MMPTPDSPGLRPWPALVATDAGPYTRADAERLIEEARQRNEALIEGLTVERDQLRAELTEYRTRASYADPQFRPGVGT